MGGQRRQGAGKDDAGGVFRVLSLAKPAVAVAIDGFDVAVVELAEGFAITQGQGDEILVAYLRGLDRASESDHVWRHRLRLSLFVTRSLLR